MATQRTLTMVPNGFAWTLAAVLLLAAPAHAAGAAGGTQEGAAIADERASYSFLRTLEGSATVAAKGEGIGDELEVNQPLLTGDLVRVSSGARLEISLSDRNRLYLDADTGVLLERLAFSGDREERVTVLRLEGGELLLAVSDEALGDELPRIITGNATVYIQQPGEYRVESGIEDSGESWTRVVTRRGFAEIVTDRGSSVVREDEAILAQGDRGTRLELAAADTLDGLERWSGVLTDQAPADSRSARYVEPHLAYAAAPLDEAGDWVEYESVRYWRPYVSSAWRPYWQGRWAWTPSGYTWVSYEPWGWVPYHYGRWCSLPGYGWAWRPGALYSPAWVYWNWTSGWAGWVPMGYYSQFYDPWYGGGYRYGVYGWAGGGWGIYSDWNFAPVHCFRDRRFRGHMRTGRDLEHESRLPEPPRGLLTTDTREFRPERIDRTEDLLHQIGKRNQPNVGQELPDVTDFVGRKGRLPTVVARVVVPDDLKDRDRIRDIGRVPKIAETPTWKKGVGDRPGIAPGEPRLKEPPVRVTGDGRKGGGDATSGSGGSSSKAGQGDKPRMIPPTSAPPVPPVETRGVAGKAPVGRATPQAPVTKAPDTRGDPVGGDNRQQWKEKGGGSEPVQRVVGSVRRPTPGSEPQAPAVPGGKGTGSISRGEPRTLPPASDPASPGKRTPSNPVTPSYGDAKPGVRNVPADPSPGYGQGSSGTPPARPSEGAGKGPATYSPGSPGSGRGSQDVPSYDKGWSGAASPQAPARGGGSGSQGASGYGKGSSGSASPQGPARSGGSGSQGASGYGKGNSGSASPQGPARSGPSGSQGTSGYGKGTSGAPSPQGSARSGSSGSQGSGRSSAGSAGSQRSQPAAKGSSGGSGSKSQSSSPPPPPPSKEDDGGH